MLSFQMDDFIRENQPIWVVELNDGRRVFQDDNRVGLEETSAWLRLKKFLSENPGLYIIGMRLQFWTNMIWIEKDMPGYYFSRGVGAWLNDTDAKTINNYNIGFLSHDKSVVIVKEYRLPELLEQRTFQKKYEDASKSDCLIER